MQRKGEFERKPFVFRTTFPKRPASKPVSRRLLLFF
jgi:hypothetical protein